MEQTLPNNVDNDIHNIENEAVHDIHSSDNYAVNDTDNVDSDIHSSDSDVSSTYISDGERPTSIFYSAVDSKQGDIRDEPLELCKNEKRQLSDFNLVAEDKAETIGQQKPTEHLQLEHVLSGDMFIFSRQSIHRAIAECKSATVPDGLLFVSWAFSEKRPVYLLGVISNTRSPNEKDSEYVVSLARAFTKRLRVEVSPNFDVVCGTIRQDDYDDEQALRSKLLESTKDTYLRTFHCSLGMNRERCVGAIRCFLTMVGIRTELSQGRTSLQRGGDGTEQEITNLSEPENISQASNVTENSGRYETEPQFQAPASQFARTSPRFSSDIAVLGSSSVGDSAPALRPLTDEEKLQAEPSIRSVIVEQVEHTEEQTPHLYAPKWGPLKDQPWDQQEVDAIRNELLTTYQQKTKGNLKILLFGPTGQGKSSLGNSFLSGLESQDKELSLMFAVSTYTSSGSTTAAFNPVKILGNSYIIDMPGIFESKAITDARIEDIVSGKVPFYAELSSHLRVKGVHINPPPGKNDVACVVIVISQDMSIGDEVKRQLNVIKKLAGKGVLSYQLVITHLDQCDHQFRDNSKLPNLYKSQRVQEAVMKISDEAGVPPFCISFVKNYVNETEKHPMATLLHLRVLKKIVSAACDQAVKRLDKASLEQHYHSSFVSKYRLILAICFVLVAILVGVYFKL